MRSIYRFVLCVTVSLSTMIVYGHDTWVQTNTNIVRVGDAVHIDLMLGNHGNNHRDFKLASKVAAKDCSLVVMAPDEKEYDLRDRLVDTGYTPTEGFWSARFVATEPGVYTAVHTCDTVMSYAPVRVVRSAKAYFVITPRLDRLPQKLPGFDKALGHALEIVPVSNPVAPMGPGIPLSVKLLFRGKPLANSTIAFIPRGETLTTPVDDRYERKTDEKGLATFIPTGGNYYLVVAHHEGANEKGEGYERTKYSATMCLFVPENCPCCDE